MQAINDFVDWRNQARALLQAGLPPDQVSLIDANDSNDLFTPISTDSGVLMLQKQNPAAEIYIPRDFINRAHWVSHHSASNRWQLMYSLAWRLVNEDRSLLANAVDEQVHLFNRMFKAVTRDYHKMKAFVRFQSIEDFSGDDPIYTAPQILEPEQLHSQIRDRKSRTSKNALNKWKDLKNANPIPDNEHFIAWFEPEHFIVPLAATFFVKRFNTMSWSVLTPHECAHWHKGRLIFTDGVARPPLPQDQTEQLWQQYYCSIFNPARIKLKAMQSEMPKKYWKNLPEAQLIKELLRSATRRVDKMVTSNTHTDGSEQ